MNVKPPQNTAAHSLCTHTHVTPFETIPPDEASQIQEITDLTLKLLQQRYPDSMARRGVHPKDHGCVQASFVVNNDIPAQYKVGVFAEAGKIYQAWVRFSNATATIDNDVSIANDKPVASSRGIAIKLIGVNGDMLEESSEAKTQDFLMINLPMFAFADVAEYLELTRIQLEHHDDIKPFFAPPLTPAKLKTLGILQRIQQTQLGNPLETQYFSASPFLFGKHTVAKFSVKPRNPDNTPLPENPSPNYLREALKKSLDVTTGKTAIFDFMVQLRTKDSLPIEDASAEWAESDAPFQTVATMTIAPQDFDNPLRITECEHMVFTPWHGLVEHQPLGGINRLRRTVYLTSAKYRLHSKEPSGFSKYSG